MKSIWMFEKVPKGDIQVIDCSEFYQIMRDLRHFPNYAGLCGEDEIMRFRNEELELEQKYTYSCRFHR